MLPLTFHDIVCLSFCQQYQFPSAITRESFCKEHNKLFEEKYLQFDFFWNRGANEMSCQQWKSVQNTHHTRPPSTNKNVFIFTFFSLVIFSSACLFECCASLLISSVFLFRSFIRALPPPAPPPINTDGTLCKFDERAQNTLQVCFGWWLCW
jgi:hypothetical protein